MLVIGLDPVSSYEEKQMSSGKEIILPSATPVRGHTLPKCKSISQHKDKMLC